MARPYVATDYFPPATKKVETDHLPPKKSCSHIYTYHHPIYLSLIFVDVVFLSDCFLCAKNKKNNSLLFLFGLVVCRSVL